MSIVCARFGFVWKNRFSRAKNDSLIEIRLIFSSFCFSFSSHGTVRNAHFRTHYRAFANRVRALPLFRVARSAVGLVSAEIVVIHQRLWKFRRPIKTLPGLPPPVLPPIPAHRPSPGFPPKASHSIAPQARASRQQRPYRFATRASKLCARRLHSTRTCYLFGRKINCV